MSLHDFMVFSTPISIILWTTPKAEHDTMKGMAENVLQDNINWIIHIKETYARRQQAVIFFGISYALWASVSLRWILEFIEQDHASTLVVSGLLALYGMLLGLEPLLTDQSPHRGHLYLLIQLALTIAALLLYIELDFFAILLMPLAGQAVFLFPRRTAITWAIVFLAANLLGQIHQFGLLDSLPFMFLYAAGILFVVGFSLSALNAEESRRRSEALLAELQTYAEQAEALAIAEERNRLARELHDSVAQTLYGLTLQAEAATRKLAAGQLEAVADYLHSFRDSAQQTLLEARLLIFELRPPVLDEVGLAGALKTRLDAVDSRSGLNCQVDLVQMEGLSPQIETGLYRIAQEALNNILRHAKANLVCLSLQTSEGRVRLEIRDDGIGFDAQAKMSHGYGLRSMRERAEQLGGSFDLQSKPKGGTTIIVETPL